MKANSFRSRFSMSRDATTFVEVQGFINREWLVEADCIADHYDVSVITPAEALIVA